MKTTMGLATAAVLAVGSLGVATAATSQAAPTAPTTTTGTTTGATTSTAVSGVHGADEARIAAAAVEALRAHPRAARAGAGQEVEVTDTVVDPDGSTHVRMERTFRGLRVLGGDLVVHRGAGAAQDAEGAAWEGVSQTLDAPLALGTTPTLGADAAGARALAPAKELREVGRLERSGRPTLVVDAHGTEPVLAWEVVSTGVREDGTPSRLASYVDARTGRVLRREEQIHTADGQGESLYSGTVPLQVTQKGSAYELRDATRGGSYTTDMGGATDGFACSAFGWGCKSGTIVTSPSTTFGDGTNADPDTAAADAQYGTAVTWDYFKGEHGRDGIFGDGSGSYNRVHYGRDYVNAFWDGQKMTYGDGDGVNYGPLVSLDVAGHEMTHGITQNTANLTYRGSRAASTRPPPTSSARWWSSTPPAARTRATTWWVRSSTCATAGASAGWTTPSPTASRPTAGRATPRTSTCTTPRAWATTSSTCWPRARARRRSGAWRTAPPPATARPSPASVARRPPTSGSGRSRST